MPGNDDLPAVEVGSRRLDYMARTRAHLSTGQLARLCGVAPRTVSKWLDAGAIPGAFRIPGGQRRERRIPAVGAVKFMRDQGLPVPPVLAAMALAAPGPAPVWAACGCRELPPVPGPGVELRRVDVLGLGAMLGAAVGPAAVVVGPELDSVTACAVGRRVRADLPGARLVAVCGADADPGKFRAAGFDAVFPEPADWAAVAAAMGEG